MLGSIVQRISGYFAGPVVAGVSNLAIVIDAIAINATKGNVFKITLVAGATQLSNPTGLSDGQIIRVRAQQPASGSEGTLTYDTMYNGGATGFPTLSTGNGKVDIIAFQYDANSNELYCLNGSGLGF